MVTLVPEIADNVPVIVFLGGNAGYESNRMLVTSPLLSTCTLADRPAATADVVRW